MTADLIVVGAGPVGLLTALLAARAGMSVEVVEQRRGPIDKACGEGIMPAGLNLLAAIGVDPDGMPIRGIRYVAGDRQVEADFAHGPGRGVRRLVLAEQMRRAAAESGVVLIEGKLIGLAQGASSVTAHLADGSLRSAAYVVGADGLHSTVRRLAGLESSRQRAMDRRRWGLRQHFALRPWTDLVEVHWSTGAEAYVTPVGRDVVGVAVLSGDRSTFATHLESFPALRELLGDAEAVSAPRGAGPLSQRSLARTRGRIALVGDAAGYVDALTGEGMSVGWRQAAALVTAITQDALPDYERLWRRVVRRSSLLTGGLLAASAFQPARALLVPAAQRIPSLFGAAVNAASRG